jgi:hypothetical protein
LTQQNRKPAALALRPKSPEDKVEQKAAEQDVFLREVDEALRKDQALGVAKRYGLAIGVAAGAGLLALAGYLYWESSTRQAAAERSERFMIALDRLDAGSDSAASQELAPLANEGTGGSKAAAAMMRAGIAQKQGKTDEAFKAYAAVAADSNVPQPFRDLATLREVAARFDVMAPQQVIDRLKPLAVPGNAWFGSAGEMLGMAYLKQGKPELAGPLFAAIAKDKGVPETLRSRGRQMAGQLGVDTIDDADKAAGAAALTKP